MSSLKNPRLQSGSIKSNKNRLFHLLLRLTHGWGVATAKVNLNMFHDLCCKRLAKRYGVPYTPHGVKPFIPFFPEDMVYNELQRLLEEEGEQQL